MSHTVKLSTQFKNINDVKEAFKAMGWQIRENTKMKTYSSDPQREKVWPFVAVNPRGGFDLAIVPNDTTGEIEIHGDTYDRGIEQQLGNNLAKLKQQYALAVVRRTYGDVEVEVAPNGEILIDAEVEY